MRRLSLVPIVLALAVSACADAPGGARLHAPDGTAPPSGEAKNTAPTRAPTARERTAFANANNAFAVDLYARLAKSAQGNLAFSPASISTALEMTWAGAKGDTASQMASVLHLGSDRDGALASAKATLEGYSGKHEGYELAFADRLFGEKSFPFDPGFVSLSGSVFGAPLEAVDFLHSSESGRQSINGFVAGATHDRIRDLLPEGSVGPSTELVLVNAVYMKTKWTHAFDKNATHPAAFAAPGGSKEVETMHAIDRFGYGETGDAQVLDMPYAGGDLAFTVILPKDANGLAAVEKKLGASSFSTYVGATHDERVDVSLPRFKVDPPKPVRLGSVLAEMGMRLAFDDLAADFGGISSEKRVRIDEVFHKAFVAVDEEGTEAAAATAVVGIEAGVTSVHPQNKAFVADHPFLFVVRDTRTQLVLFIGRVTDPAA